MFPQGLQKVTAADFAAGAAPDRGLIVEGPNDRFAAAGVREGDLLVAADGYRVRDYNQWRVATGFSRDPAMSFVVYREGRYTSVSGRFPGRALSRYLREWTKPGR